MRRFIEGVLTSTHNLCLRAKLRKLELSEDLTIAPPLCIVLSEHKDIQGH